MAYGLLAVEDRALAGQGRDAFGNTHEKSTMPDRDSKPKPLGVRPEVGYPRLADHRCQRCGFLKNVLLSVGALSMGAGKALLVGCTESHGPRPENDNGLAAGAGSGSPYPQLNVSGGLPEPYYPGPPENPPPTDGGVTVQPPEKPETLPADAGTDAAPPEVDPEWPLDGDVVSPEYHTVRLPASGFRSTLINAEEDLTYAVSFITYDAGLAEFYREIAEDPNQWIAYDHISRVLNGYGCNSLNVGLAEPDIASVLEEHYRAQSVVQNAVIESLSLLVESCLFMPLGGGLPSPDY
jgi:hypothetical protein